MYYFPKICSLCLRCLCVYVWSIDTWFVCLFYIPLNLRPHKDFSGGEGLQVEKLGKYWLSSHPKMRSMQKFCRDLLPTLPYPPEDPHSSLEDETFNLNLNFSPPSLSFSYKCKHLMQPISLRTAEAGVHTFLFLTWDFHSRGFPSSPGGMVVMRSFLIWATAVVATVIFLVAPCGLMWDLGGHVAVAFFRSWEDEAV